MKIKSFLALTALCVSFWLGAAEQAAGSYLILLPLEIQRNGNSRLVSRASAELEAEFAKLGLSGHIGFCDKTLTAEKLSHYNVVVFGVAGYAFQRPIRGQEAERVGKLLLDYVNDGGGLLIMRNPGYQFDTEIQEINKILLKPLGGEILPEQMWDTEAKNTHHAPGGQRVYWTNEIVPHPVTEGVRGLFYPDLFSPYHRYTDFSTAVKVDANWQILAYGSRSARTYYRKKGGDLHEPAKGTYDTRPPFLAVREYGKGRVALMPVASTIFWHDTHHPFWQGGKFADGVDNGHAGNNMLLIVNLMRYLAAPTQGKRTPEAPEAWKPVGSAQSDEPGLVAMDWSKKNSYLRGKYFDFCCTGLIGAQSSLSIGQGKPEEFIAAAKKAGYDFIAFAEEFDKMTQEKFAALQKICKDHTKDGFYAYPGFSMMDEAGNRWVTFSDQLTWPPAEWMSKKYPKRMSNCNPFSRGWGWPPMILTCSRTNNDRPFFRGNYKIFSAYTYRDGKLIDDSFDEFLRLEQDNYELGITAVHFVTAPEMVAAARKTGFQASVRWLDPNMLGAFRGNHCIGNNVYYWNRPLFLTQGPVIEDFRIMNFGDSDLAVRGLERWRMHVRVTSPVGIDTIEIFEHEQKNIWRRFRCNGKTAVDLQIDGHHSRRHAFVMRVTDKQGRQAISWEVWTGLQENGYSRCSDNMNTMPRGKWWGPPKHQQNVRGFEDFMVVRELSYCGTPFFPELGSEGTLPAMEYRPLLVNRFATVVECRLKAHWPLGRHPNLDSMDSSQPTRENEYYDAVVRYTIFVGRQDSAILELIDGTVNIQDEFVSRPRIYTNLGRVAPTHLTYQEPSGEVRTVTPVPAPFFAPIAKNGFAALYPDPFKGQPAIIPLMDELYLETAKSNQILTELHARFGEKPRRFKAGDVFRYRYLAAIGAFGKDAAFVQDIIGKLGIKGKPVYTIRCDSGKIVSQDYVLRLAAEKGGFSGKISRTQLPIDLPVILSGLNKNWDAVIWYRGKNQLMIPQRTFDDRGLDYVGRHPQEFTDEVRYLGMIGDEGYAQIDTELGDRDVFIGHPLLCDNPCVRLSLIDHVQGRGAFEVHNPTDQEIVCTVTPAPALKELGEFKIKVTLVPGSSQVIAIPQKGEAK